MKNLFLLVSTFACVSMARGGELTIDEQSVSFGEKYQFAQIDQDVRVWNRSKEAISFREAKLPPGVTLTPEKKSVAAGESALLHMKAELRNRLGAVSLALPIETEEGSKAEHYEIVLEGFVDTILDEPKPSIDFGMVDAAARAEKSVRLSSSSNPEFRISRVLETPDFVAAHIAPDGQTLLLAPRKFDVLGYSKGIVKVALESAPQSQAWVTVVMDIHGNIVPDQNPLKFELQRPSTAKPMRLQLTSRDGKAVHIGKITLDAAPHMSVDATACLPKARDDCQAYMVGIKPEHGYGMLFGKIGFELPDTHQTLNVHLGGVYLSDTTKIRSLNEPAEGNQAGDQAPVSAQSEAPRSIDLTQSLKKAVEDKANAAPQGAGPLLKWQVANEAGIYGYAIYRGDSAEGRFVRINETIVKAENSGDNTTANYQWRDTTAQKGREYCYYIMIFNNSGKKTQLTGPQKVLAK